MLLRYTSFEPRINYTPTTNISEFAKKKL